MAVEERHAKRRMYPAEFRREAVALAAVAYVTVAEGYSFV